MKNITINDTTYDENPASIYIVKRHSEKAGKDYSAVKVEVGEWSTLVFAEPFAIKYLSNYLEVVDETK